MSRPMHLQRSISPAAIKVLKAKYSFLGDLVETSENIKCVKQSLTHGIYL